MKLLVGFLAIARGFEAPLDNAVNPKILLPMTDSAAPSDGSIAPRGSQENIMTDVLADCSRYSWSMNRCGTEMTDKLYSRLGDRYSCLVTDKYYDSDVAGWAVHHAYHAADRYANCGKKSRSSVNSSKFKDKCDQCANICLNAGDITDCVRDCIKDAINVSLLIARNGAVGGATYGGVVHSSRYGNIICGGYYHS